MSESFAAQPKGLDRLQKPDLNKGTAYSAEERRALHMEGLLPPSVENLDAQVARVLEHLDHQHDDLDRYIYLIDLEERNQTVFYKTIMSDPKRFIPILYDPTVADACEAFGEIYRRPRGMYITRHMKGRMAEVLRNWPEKDVRFICVSTGGRILGLGDIGANGMGIPIGKLQLYTACAAVPPQYLLPVLFDIGTSNEKLRNDPRYLGVREKPVSEKELDELTEEFVQAVQEVFPNCCVHFEDWKGTDAIRMLERYRDRVLCYNDDIQGTASVVLAGLEAAMTTTKTAMKDQRVLFLGAGSAGLGISKLITSAMMEDGLSLEEARKRIALFDINGLIEPKRSDLTETQKLYARAEMAPSKNFVEVIKQFKPTILIGVSTKPGAFTQEVVEAMAALNERPVIFALSNPTHKVECTAEQAYTWSKGKVIFAAGVQFPEFDLDGKHFYPGQANNFYIYPAIGLATFVAKPKLLNDACFIAAAKATAAQVTPEMRKMGRMYPSQDNILETEIRTAVGTIEYMFEAGLAQIEKPADIDAYVREHLYKPEY